MHKANVAVVGGGIFGCTAAHIISRAGHKVTLFEQHHDIMLCASHTNQRRLHRGYHYPRSHDTVVSLSRSIESFKREYCEAVYNCDESLYCIARDGSLVTSDDYIKFCNEHELPISIITNHPLVNHMTVDLIVRVEEQMFDYTTLKKIVTSKLSDSQVTIKTSSRFTDDMRSRYDIVVNATYARLNELTTDLKRREYQFEICEKIAVEVPKVLDSKSIVILDGPFCCIDPMGRDTHLSQLGHVVHAVRSVNVGHTFLNAASYKIDSAMTRDISHSKFNNFISGLRDFIPAAAGCQYVGSHYTVRAVQPYVDSTDQRPTVVDWVSDRQVNLFSGKIDTCVSAAEDILKEII